MTQTPEPADHVQLVQQAISELDPDAMCIGFAAVVEWIEADGSSCLSVVHTPMPPWHLKGLLEYASQWETSGNFPVVVLDEGEWDQDLEEDDGL